MREILELLDKSEFIAGYEVTEYRDFKEGFYVKIIAHLTNSTELYIREYSDADERDYSYHWQDKDSNPTARWDNSPYHKNISTFPHHKHLAGRILPSYEVTIQDVLRFIEKELKGAG